MKKNAFFTLLLLIAVTVASAQTYKTSTGTSRLHWIKFNWVGDSLGTKYFDKAAIILPIRINGLPFNNLSAQFDLGADQTILYGKSLMALTGKYPTLLKKIDTTKNPFDFEGNYKGRYIKNAAFKLDGTLFARRQVAYIYNYGDVVPIEPAKTAGPNMVGTVGADLFQNKILVIDYPNRRLCVLENLPTEMTKKASFVPFKVRKGRIKLPFTFGGKEHDVMFDTGASVSPIYTAEDNLIYFTRPGQPVIDSLVASSWGKAITDHAKMITEEVKLGKTKMPPALVYYRSASDSSMKKFLNEENVVGLTGNVYFLNNIIIIDYKNNRFGVL